MDARFNQSLTSTFMTHSSLYLAIYLVGHVYSHVARHLHILLGERQRQHKEKLSSSSASSVQRLTGSDRTLSQEKPPLVRLKAYTGIHGKSPSHSGPISRMMRDISHWNSADRQHQNSHDRDHYSLGDYMNDRQEHVSNRFRTGSSSCLRLSHKAADIRPLSDCTFYK